MNTHNMLFFVIVSFSFATTHSMESQTPPSTTHKVLKNFNNRLRFVARALTKRKIKRITSRHLSKLKRNPVSMEMEDIMKPEINVDELKMHLSDGKFETSEEREKLTKIGMDYYHEYSRTHNEVGELNNIFAKLRLVIINSCYSTEYNANIREDEPLGRVFLSAYNELRDIKQKCAPFMYVDAKNLSLAQLLLEIAKHPSPSDQLYKDARNVWVKYLLDLGVDCTSTDATGCHALLYAAQRGDKTLYNLLKDHPKSAGMTDSAGRTAEQIVNGFKPLTSDINISTPSSDVHVDDVPEYNSFLHDAAVLLDIKNT